MTETDLIVGNETEISCHKKIEENSTGKLFNTVATMGQEYPSESAESNSMY